MTKRRKARHRKGKKQRRTRPRQEPATGSPAQTPAGAAGSAAEERGDGSSSWLRVTGACAAMAALIAAVHWRVVFFGETFVERDALRFTLPSREFLVRALRDWRIPEWLDGVNFGVPFAANPVHEVLTPLGWTLALWPTGLGFDIHTLMQILVGAMGTAALSRRLGASPTGAWAAGASLALSGYVTSMISNGFAPALAWAPWTAWAAHRLATRQSESPEGRTLAGSGREIAVLAALLALQMAVGEPVSIVVAALLSWLVIAVYGPRMLTSIASIAVAVAGAVALAAHAVLPGALLFAGSARQAGLETAGLAWSLHPARLAELVWPMVFGTQVGDGWYAGLLLRDEPGDPFWSYSLFLGMPILLAAGLTWAEPRLRKLLLGSIPFVLLAFGPYTPIYPLLARLVPPVALLRFPEKFIYAVLLLWIAAAGVGITRMLGRGPAPRSRWLALAAAAMGFAVTALSTMRGNLSATIESRADEWGYFVRPDTGIAAALEGGLVATAGLGLLFLALELRSRSWRWFPGLILVAVLGPLAWTAGATQPLAPRSVVAAVPAVLRPLQADAGSSDAPRPRLFRTEPRQLVGPFSDGQQVARFYHESIDTNIASRFGVTVVPGFEPAESARSRQFGRRVFPGMSDLAAVRLLGLEWIATDSDQLNAAFRQVAVGEEGWRLFSTGAVRPRAFVAPRWRAAATPDQALHSLALPGRERDPAAIALTIRDETRPPAAGPLSPCDVRQVRPEDVRLTCDSPTGGYAVLLDEWAPGWSATVDGSEAEIRLADGLFRAVAIGPGTHEVRYRYRTPGLRLGIGVSMTCWLVCGLLIVRRRGRS